MMGRVLGALLLAAMAAPLWAQQDNGTFVTSLYIATHNRNPDPSGWLYWKGLLDTGSLTRDRETN